MKRLILFLFVLCCAFSFGQTRPDWLDIKNKAFTDVRNFGVKGDGTTDDWPSLKAAIEAGGIVVIPKGLNIVISGSQSDIAADWIQVSVDTHIVNLGSSIQQKTGTWSRYMLPLSITSSFLNVSIDGLNMNGGGLSYIGINARLAAGKIGGKVLIKNSIITSFASPGDLPFRSSAVEINGQFDNVIVDGVFVGGVTRTPNADPSASASGITIVDATGVVNIANSKIKNILSNATVNWIGANSVNISAASNTDPLFQVQIENNLIENTFILSAWLTIFGNCSVCQTRPLVIASPLACQQNYPTRGNLFCRHCGKQLQFKLYDGEPMHK